MKVSALCWRQWQSVKHRDSRAAGWVVSSLVLGVYLGGDFAKRLPMANQLIYTIRDTRRFTEHEATSSAYELLEQVEGVSYTDTHFLQNVVG